LNYIALQSTPKKAKPLFEFDLGPGNSSFGERLQTQLLEAAESGRGPLSHVRIHQIDGSDSDVEFILDNSDRAQLATEDEAQESGEEGGDEDDLPPLPDDDSDGQTTPSAHSTSSIEAISDDISTDTAPRRPKWRELVDMIRDGGVGRNARK